MDNAGHARRAWLSLGLCSALLTFADSLQAACYTFVDPHPASGNLFGHTVVALSTGNVVITAPHDNAKGSNTGAVYLFNGSTGALISALLGTSANDLLGLEGVTALSNGNFVIANPYWDNGAIPDAGAVTWGSGTTGVSGQVSIANSLIGSTANDRLGIGGARALSNGNYVVASPTWNNGVGAATWGSGTVGVKGVVSSANSLTGSTAPDGVGDFLTALSNGNYVVGSPGWNGTLGAVTWGSGTSGVKGVVSIANSLIGAKAGDQVGRIPPDTPTLPGSNGVFPLTNGNYVVASPTWDYGSVVDAGATTWRSGTSGAGGVVSPANSLIGTTAYDQVGGNVTALSNGNYVVASPSWHNGFVANAGAVTLQPGAGGQSGGVASVNSLVGTTAGDFVGEEVTALSNGSYVVTSPHWHNGPMQDAGAATWGAGGVIGPVSAANSLVGASGDLVGDYGVRALSNGNYVVLSADWNSGAGAATWGSGTAGISGVVGAGNSLVGTKANDYVGYRVMALTNGNYVVSSFLWDNGAVVDAGAATWGNGTTGVKGAVSTGNSLVGAKIGDEVGISVTALSNGNYVVSSPTWDDGAVVNAGAATWRSGTSGLGDVVSAANSLMGTKIGDDVGTSVTALSNGNYVVISPHWHNGAMEDAGAATWESGTSGATGVVSTANSLVGAAANADLLSTIVEANPPNGTFYASFLEDDGKVRIGPLDYPPALVSVGDIPNDQGGWIRLLIGHSCLDDVFSQLPIASYGVWRHVPGTSIANASKAQPSAVLSSLSEALGTQRPQSAFPGYETWEVGGRLFVKASDLRPESAFPPGTWELVASVPAEQKASYMVAVPTISNAAPNDFLVTANTTTPSIWFVSIVVSAQSFDNLAPAQPSQVSAAYANGQTNLQWAANTEPDLDFYRLYRGASVDFTPSPQNLIASPASPSYADVGPAGNYYKISAVDVNGNESSFALITPQQTTGVGDGVPVVFALEGVLPNPTRGNNLNVAFGLPTGEPARLDLWDVRGRVILVREVGSLGPGRHTVNLAKDRRVAAGVYWVQLVQGANRQRARLAVVE